MNKIKTFGLSAILIVTFVDFSLSQSGQGSSTGLAFLKLGIGGRASALGEAYTAVTDEATATYWNPAGLAFVNRAELAFTHTEWIQGITNDFFAFVFPAFRGTIGLSFYSNNVGGIERRVIPSAEPLGSVEAHDIAFGISYARAFNSWVNGGLTVKYLYEKISIESASGFAFDFGVSFQPFQNNIRLAAVAQNIGSMGKLREQSIDLPKTVRVGLAYLVEIDAIGGAILFAADGVKVSETEFRGNFGAELQLKQMLAFRLGYQTGFDEKSLGGGFGLNFERYHLDYGYTPFNSNFGDTHRFSLRLNL